MIIKMIEQNEEVGITMTKKIVRLVNSIKHGDIIIV